MALAGLLAAALGLMVVFSLGRHETPPPAQVRNATPAPAADTGNESLAALREQDQSAPQLYEEAFSSLLAEESRRSDYALLKTLMDKGLGPDRLVVLQTETRSHNGLAYPFQALDISLDGPAEEFLNALNGNLDDWAPAAELTPLNATAWEISAMHLPTHLLLLRPGPAQAPAVTLPKTTPAPAEARLAIVIDDLGESPADARTLAGLNFPVAFSIWPRSTHAAEVAEIAHAAGRDVLVHQPMEPLHFPEVNPGPGTLFTNMTSAQIRQIVDLNLDLVPHAVGMNNHMGSKFTQDAAAVRTVLSELRKRNLFVLDSVTHPRTTVAGEAQRLGLRHLSRDVFLDVVRDTPAILRQLAKAQRLALRQGEALAIGHPFPETLAALARWQQERDPRVQLVLISTLRPPSPQPASASR